MSNSDSSVITKKKVTLKTPRMYRVILLNDDYTSMDFVVSILERIFQKSPAEAVQIMLAVHNQGRGVCGIYPRQIAEAKVDQVQGEAKAASYPLRCIIEEE